MKITLLTSCSGDWEGKPFSFGGGERDVDVPDALGIELIRAQYAEESVPKASKPGKQGASTE